MKLGAIAFGCLVAVATATSCSAQSKYRFVENEGGTWVPLSSPARTSASTAAAEVSCQGHSALVKITWYSDSGDWTAFDSYASNGVFFSRTLKFAQFPIKVLIHKKSPSAKAMIRYIGQSQDVSEYRDTTDLPDVHSFSSLRDFPFQLPNCAQNAFKRVFARR
jgi:hypothetical protein